MDQSLDYLKGTTTFFNHQYSADTVTVTICCALTFYNGIELLLLTATTFQHYKGSYFWSVLIATLGLFLYDIGFTLGYFQLSLQIVSEIISAIGWPMMVTGQSFVLYSRLGIVLAPNRQWILKAVKAMIIFNGVVFYITTEVLVLGTFNTRNNKRWAEGYRINEYVQMTFYSTQELILSGLYLWCAVRILKNLPYNGKRSRIMRDLFGINIIIVIMEVTLLVMEYQNRHVVEQSLKGFVYSVKLKLEFAVLSRLIATTWRANENQGDFYRLDNTQHQDSRGPAMRRTTAASDFIKQSITGTATHFENGSKDSPEIA